jgi:hypothetical protein
VKISHYAIGNQNWSESGDSYLTESGVRVKALYAADTFGSSNDEEFSGSYTGSRLFLAENGWIEITRTGRWSSWQGSPDYWTCDGSDDKEFDSPGGGIRHLTDEQVASEWDVQEVAKLLADSLSKLAVKLPERLTRKRALAESIKTAIDALK